MGENGILNVQRCKKKVLNVGSGDINGNNRFLFEDCEYDGNKTKIYRMLEDILKLNL